MPSYIIDPLQVRRDASRELGIWYDNDEYVASVINANIHKTCRVHCESKAYFHELFRILFVINPLARCKRLWFNEYLIFLAKK